MAVVARAGYSDAPLPAAIDRTIGTRVVVKTFGYSALFNQTPSAPGWLVAAASVLLLLLGGSCSP